MENREKYLSFVVPCYNSESYMARCIESLLPGGEDVEIIIIDDGSKDKTGEIADAYQKQYPDLVKVIHKENGGHGSGVNAGLACARGVYFKVVDSDDWLDGTAYQKLLEKIRYYCKEAGEGEEKPDLFVCNYVYNHLEQQITRSMGYGNVFPAEKICPWSETGHFLPSQYLVMHALVYRTEILLQSGIVLPEHTFYVDNIYVYYPLPHVRTLYYMDVDFYRYFIGRDDQSVNERVMISRIDQQIRVNKIMVDAFDLWKIPNRKLRHYMFNYLEIITVISTIMLIRSGTEENLEKKRELWKYIKEKDIRLFHHLRAGILGNTMNLPGKGGRKISVAAYKLSQKVVGFN